MDYDTTKLKLLRKKMGYSVYDMGKLLGITGSFYSQLENKKRRLFYDLACKIAAIFELKPDDLFYMEG